MDQHLRAGSTITLATGNDFFGLGAGFLYADRDLMPHVSEGKPAEIDSRFNWLVEKPPQKTGTGNPDLSHIYSGDDILIRSVGNGKYMAVTSSYGGFGIPEIMTSEHNAKHDYRGNGSGSMSCWRIIAMDQPMGSPVLLDGLHKYAIVNVRLVGYLSASPEYGVRTVGSAGPREAWFITDAFGRVPSKACYDTHTKVASMGGGLPPVTTPYPPGSVSTLAISSKEKKDIAIGSVVIFAIIIIAIIAYFVSKKKKTA